MNETKIVEGKLVTRLADGPWMVDGCVTNDLSIRGVDFMLAVYAKFGIRCPYPFE